MKRPYGYELILDLHGCDVGLFTRKNIGRFFDVLCRKIKMKACARHWWDDVGVPSKKNRLCRIRRGRPQSSSS